MPGNILDVKVKTGDTVTKGQVLMVLEAMKMENDIVAPCDGTVTSVIAKKGDKLAGFIVDELIGQQEIVIKSMGKYINKCKFISGATILGDGEIALIIDANALM